MRVERVVDGWRARDGVAVELLGGDKLPPHTYTFEYYTLMIVRDENLVKSLQSGAKSLLKLGIEPDPLPVI